MSIFTVKLSSYEENYVEVFFKHLEFQAPKNNDSGSLEKVLHGKPPLTNSLKYELFLAAVKDYKKTNKQKKLNCAQPDCASKGIDFNTLINFFFMCSL